MAVLDDTRDDWDARPPTRPLTPVPWADRLGVSWHWIGPGRGILATSPHSLCLDLVNRWQLQHQTRAIDPWKDIGYNALVCQHARAIEGRGLSVQGSHSPGVNWSHVGVQFMVGADGPPPSPEMYDRAVRLRADVGALGKNIYRDWGHRDDPKASTTCPGDVIDRWVDSGGPTTEGDDMPLTDDDIKKVGTEVWTRPVYDADGQKVTTGAGLGTAMRDSTAALQQLKVVGQLIADLGQQIADLSAKVAALESGTSDPAAVQENVSDALHAAADAIDPTPEGA